MFYLGLILFFCTHLFASLTGLRAGLVAALGEKSYKLGFVLLSVAGLVLVCIGYNPQSATFYQPVLFVYKTAHMYMPLAFVLVASAHMPCHIKQWVKHPMLTGMLVWSLTHLAVNPDQHSVLLFGGFALYSLYALVSALARGKTIPNKKPVAWKYDLFAVLGGLVAYALLFGLHNWLFGVSPMLLHAG